MAERVGKLHVHELPENRDLPVREDAYKCYCGTEFMVEENTESGFNKSPKKWTEVPGNFAIEYDRTVGGQKFIGRAGEDTVFDEEVSDGQAVAEGDGSEVSGSGETTSGTA